jgi:chaperonin GroES
MIGGFIGVPSRLVSSDPHTDTGLPIRMLHDRVLVRLDGKEGERRSSAGIVIPATATMGRRLSWATAVGVGPNVRSIVVGDRVLFDPDDRSEVELHGREFVLLRERDVHAVAASRVEPDGTGLYL